MLTSTTPIYTRPKKRSTCKECGIIIYNKQSKSIFCFDCARRRLMGYKPKKLEQPITKKIYKSDYKRIYLYRKTYDQIMEFGKNLKKQSPNKKDNFCFYLSELVNKVKQ